MPMTKAAHGRTKPAHGVMVARPAIAPTQSPTIDGLPKRIHSMSTHTERAVDAAISELTAAYAAPPVDASAEPPLKPKQPNHRSAVPRPTKGMLCGVLSGSLPSIFARLPRTWTAASAEKPAVVCTTMPPAKSLMPHSAIHPPPHTQWQKGAYTKTIQSAMKRRYGANLSRSANAPVMSAGVITANMPW